MRLDNLDLALIVRAIGLIFVAGIALSFLTSCLSVWLWPPEMIERLTDTLGRVTDPNASQQELQNDLISITDEYASELAAQYVVQWSLAGLVTFSIARRTAARAATSSQATGYGVAIGVGTAFTYGVMCVMCTITALWLRLLFFLVFILAGMFGGQSATPGKGKRELPGEPLAGPSASAPPLWPGGLAAPRPASGPRPEIYYNMGVTAAQGGRREEARQHFTRVVQLQPRNMAAWLQLANLADTPDQAWNYVQQARKIDPNNPQVKQAVDIIWPQVQAEARRPASLQPPYPGAGPDDANIPSVKLPRPTPPDEPSPPDPDTLA